MEIVRCKNSDEFIIGDDDDAYGEDNNEEGELSDDSLEKGGSRTAANSKRLSPEKEMALQTLDDVLNEAEKSMGEFLFLNDLTSLMLGRHRNQSTICTTGTSNNSLLK